MEGESRPRGPQAAELSPFSPADRRDVRGLDRAHRKTATALVAVVLLRKPPLALGPHRQATRLCRGVATAAQHTRRGVAATSRRIRRRVNRHRTQKIACDFRRSSRPPLASGRPNSACFGAEGVSSGRYGVAAHHRGGTDRAPLCGSAVGSIAAEGDSLMGRHSDEVCAVVSAKAERQADNERGSGTELAKGITRALCGCRRRL